jgi:(p)ppGpp synthase/HD superfamily hydrolase
MKIYDSWSSWAQGRAQVAMRIPPGTLTGLDRAFSFALAWHGDQLRPTGEPYVVHLLEVTEILIEGAGVRDKEMLIAGVLHDVLEDTECPPEEIRASFGPGVHDLVVWLTKPEDEEGDPPGTARKRYLDAFSEAPPAARILKLADRLSNVQKLDRHSNPEKQRFFYEETVEKIIPFASEADFFDAQYREWKERFAYLKSG